MQSGSLLQLVFALSSLIISKAKDVMESGHSCLRWSPADDGLTRVTFLREDSAGLRSLYLTLWSEDMRLESCEVNTNPLVTERYRTLCGRSTTQAQGFSLRFNISMLLAPDAPCALVSSSAPKFTKRSRRDGTEGRTRRKRWIFPGTLWCGTGSKAVQYDELGMFESTDKCCREHDHCLHIIPSFTTNYGVFNSRFYTVSHCDCDQRFRQCLLDVNDSISSMVGYSFFNIIQVPCFELKEQTQCTEMHWWGMCKVSKDAPYAVFKSPLPYNTTDVLSKYGHNTDSNNTTSSEGPHVTKSPIINPHAKSPKSKPRCRSKDPSRGNTFNGRKRNGIGCKRHRKLHIVTPSRIPPTSRVHNTTPSMETGLLHTSSTSTSTLMESTIKGLMTYPTQKGQVPPQVTTNSYPQTTSATQGTPSVTREPALRLNLTTAVTAVTKSTKGHKKVPKHSRCCGSQKPLRGDSFQPHCKSCLEQNTTSHTITNAPSTTTNGTPIKVTTLKTQRLQNTGTETPKQDTLKTLRSGTTMAMPATTKLKTTASIHKVGKQMDSHLLWNNTSEEPMGRTKAPSTHAEKGLKVNIALYNLTDKHHLCLNLKHLDYCEYKIPPLEKKYGLQNIESKMVYHCDCTSRLAVQIKSLKQPSTLPALLMDFVSQYCFKLPKKKKCHSDKSCSGGFAKASDLLRALKKIEEKDAAGVRNSGNDRKRGIPVRLYKRCLRLERKADIMAQLT